jgi:hypothetical protein
VFGALLPLLLASPPAVVPPAGPHALFWSGGRTWVLDAGAGRLFSAPGFLTLDVQGGLIRFRQRVEAHRPGAREAGLPAPASRRTVWEQVTTPARAWSPAVAPPEPWPPAGAALMDERALLQFTGEALTTLRFQRFAGPDASTRTVIEGAAYRPDTGRADPAPAGAGAALAWTAAHLPFALDPCLVRPAGILPLEGPGGVRTPYLLAAGAAPECADRVRALALSAPPRTEGWGPGVLDRRPLPDARGAVLLLGEAAENRPALVDDLLALANPCVLQTLRLERDGLHPLDVGAVPALDGFRWLSADAPWLTWLPIAFAPAERCGAAVPILPGDVRRFDGDVDDWPADALRTSAALCRVVEIGRAWSGPDDLSGEAVARVQGADLVVAVVVRDRDPAPADVVRVLTTTGDASVDRDGRVDTSSLSGLRAAVSSREGGYAMEIRLPRAAFGTPPRLAIAVDDADGGDPPGAGLRLWIAGEPVGTQSGQPLPLENLP